MSANQCDIGLIGLAVMGENLVLNMESKGFSVAVFNRTTSVTEKFAAGRAKGKQIVPCRTMEEFVAALKRPRKAQIMVKAGAPVDAVIEQLVPLLEPNDIIIDGGNSLWTDTQRREKALAGKGIRYFGVGVSGGEEGALHGPSIMPGGSREGWEHIAPIYRKIAAQVDGEPWTTRNVGDTLEIESVVGPNGTTIDVNLVPQTVRLAGVDEWRAEAGGVPTPSLKFETEKVVTSLPVQDGRPALLATATPALAAPDAHEKVRGGARSTTPRIFFEIGKSRIDGTGR